jgi:protein-S-isoprenylcysteine O-methyltransferase Ste14
MLKQSTFKARLFPWVFIAIQAMLILLVVFIDSGNTIVSVFERTASYFLILIGFIGLIMSGVNLGKSLTALPIPKEKAELQVDGLYKYVRHPMYTSVLMICFGISGINGSFLKTIFCVLLVILFIFKAKYEEKLLAKKFKGYSDYAKNTAMFLPLKLSSK